MKLKTFTGETPGEALKKAQIECGEEALVVNTKEVKKKTLTTPALYEVVVAIEEESKAPETSLPIDDSPLGEDVILNLSETFKQINKIAEVTETESTQPFQKSNEPAFQYPSPKTPPKETSPTSTTKAAPYNDIQKEIGKLTDKVKLIQNMIWDQKSDQRQNLSIPPEFAEIYRLAKRSGLTGEHLDEIMKLSLQHMPLSMRQNSGTVKRYFNVLLRRLIPIRMEPRLTKPNKKILMLVGPTGVGKTTTIAKLAARFAFKSDVKYRVGIITVDTYRIGAVEQLMHYAKIMKLGIETVEDPMDFSHAIQSLKHCDYILIDTAGSSQHDHDKITKLKQFLDAEHQMSIDVALVISASQKYEDLRDVYRNFSVLGIDSLISTKLDETNGYGNLFSLVYDTKKPISYFSTGQEVPDDLQPATADYLVECLLDGFKREDA